MVISPLLGRLVLKSVWRELIVFSSSFIALMKNRRLLHLSSQTNTLNDFYLTEVAKLRELNVMAAAYTSDTLVSEKKKVIILN